MTMSRIKSSRVIATLIVALIALPGTAAADDESRAPAQGGYVLKSYTIGSAGAPGAAAARHSHGTMGQPTPIGVGTTDSNTLHAGFWAQVWTSIPTASQVPVAYRNELFQNYPNPFNPTTTVEYSVERADRVEIRIYNVRGQEVKTLVNENRPPGRYRTQWDGRSNSGSAVASGVYFYRLTIGPYSAVKKLVLLK
jgi:hypothetical protein